MQDTLKKDFTLRVTQANRTQLTVIIYEICLSYLDEAMTGENAADHIAKARKCIDELKRSLNFEYELAGQLLHLYIYVNKLLARAAVSGRTEPLAEARGIVTKLHDAFVKVSEEDTSKPLTHNAQEVYAGYTYGKNDINVNISGNTSERGFLV